MIFLLPIIFLRFSAELKRSNHSMKYTHDKYDKYTCFYSLAHLHNNRRAKLFHYLFDSLRGHPQQHCPVCHPSPAPVIQTVICGMSTNAEVKTSEGGSDTCLVGVVCIVVVRAFLLCSATVLPCSAFDFPSGCLPEDMTLRDTVVVDLLCVRRDSRVQRHALTYTKECECNDL